MITDTACGAGILGDLSLAGRGGLMTVILRTMSAEEALVVMTGSVLVLFVEVIGAEEDTS